MKKTIGMAVVAAVCMAACAAARAQGKEDFLRQQAYAEMQRVSGQVDVLQSNLGDLQRRISRLEGGGDSKGIRQEVDALKAEVAGLRREIRSQHDEIVRELSAKFAAMLKNAAPPPPPPAPRPAKPAYTGPCKEYVVESGDTLSVIATAFNTKVSVLRSMNNLKNDNLRVGQKILVPKTKE